MLCRPTRGVPRGRGAGVLGTESVELLGLGSGNNSASSGDAGVRGRCKKSSPGFAGALWLKNGFEGLSGIGGVSSEGQNVNADNIH